jgi:diguanylate cyclase (GGDEF)-like protein/PAS domain S-box-containing protein
MVTTQNERSPLRQTRGVDPKYKDTFLNAEVGLTHVDLDGQFIRVNPYLCQFWGYEESELLSMSFKHISRPEELPESVDWIRSVLAGETDTAFSKIKQYRHKQGHWVWAKLTTKLMRSEAGEPDYFVSSIQDVSELIKVQTQLDNSLTQLKIAYAELKELSTTDSLTSALNVLAFREHLNEAIERYKRTKEIATLFFLDLDSFKDVNDKHGHVAGDHVLIELVDTIKSAIRGVDYIGRLGGDEFAVLLTNTTKAQSAELRKRLGNTVSITFGPEGEQLTTGVSMGISELGQEISTVEQWISASDKMMYSDKEKREKTQV